jgi:hypothetical protein
MLPTTIYIGLLYCLSINNTQYIIVEVTRSPNFSCFVLSQSAVLMSEIRDRLRGIIKGHILVSQIPGLFRQTYNCDLELGGKLKPKLKEIFRDEIQFQGLHICYLITTQIEQESMMLAATSTEVEPIKSEVKSKSPEVSMKIATARTVRTLPALSTRPTLSVLHDSVAAEHKVEESVSFESESVGHLFDKFYENRVADEFEIKSHHSHSVLMGCADYANCRLHEGTGAGLLGSLRCQEDQSLSSDQHVYLNTRIPFCMVCVGTQGAGKSHTMNVTLENCMMACPLPSARPIITQPHQMCGLLFHHDQSDLAVCEAVGLGRAKNLSIAHNISGMRRLVILVSPSYYNQRKRFYGDEYEVIPLLFKWQNLGAEQLKRLMRLSDKDNQLYVSVMLGMLRRYQKEENLPDLMTF